MQCSTTQEARRRLPINVILVQAQDASDLGNYAQPCTKNQRTHHGSIQKLHPLRSQECKGLPQGTATAYGGSMGTTSSCADDEPSQDMSDLVSGSAHQFFPSQ